MALGQGAFHAESQREGALRRQPVAADPFRHGRKMPLQDVRQRRVVWSAAGDCSRRQPAQPGRLLGLAAGQIVPKRVQIVRFGKTVGQRQVQLANTFREPDQLCL